MPALFLNTLLLRLFFTLCTYYSQLYPYFGTTLTQFCPYFGGIFFGLAIKNPDQLVGVTSKFPKHLQYFPKKVYSVMLYDHLSRFVVNYLSGFFKRKPTILACACIVVRSVLVAYAVLFHDWSVSSLQLLTCNLFDAMLRCPRLCWQA